MKNNPFDVRIAGPHDQEELMELLPELYKEEALMSISLPKLRDTIERGTTGQGGLIGVIDGDHGIEATIGMAFHQFFYTEDWVLNELWLCVKPEYRQSTHAKRLVEFGKWCADQLSNPQVRIPFLYGVVTRHRLLPKMRLFGRHAPQIGALFLHGVEMPDTFSQRKSTEVH